MLDKGDQIGYKVYNERYIYKCSKINSLENWRGNHEKFYDETVSDLEYTTGFGTRLPSGSSV